MMHFQEFRDNLKFNLFKFNLILHSENLRMSCLNHSLCCSQLKRTEPTANLCTAEIYKQGINPSEASINCAALQTARPCWTQSQPQGPAGEVLALIVPIVI